MNPGIYVIIVFGENLYGGRNHIVILETIQNFGRNAIEESER